MRRQSYPRERHEAGGEPRHVARHAAARRQGDDIGDRFLSDQADAAGEIRRQELGSLRPGDRLLIRTPLIAAIRRVTAGALASLVLALAPALAASLAPRGEGGDPCAALGEAPLRL